MSYTLEFNEELHEYRVDGVVVPSVTTIIAAAGLQPDMSWIDPFYLERGTAVHKATELVDLGTLDWDTIDGNVAPYLASYQKFCDDMGTDYEVLDVEMRAYNPHYRYAGTIDRVARFRGQVAVVDLKCGAKLACHALQLSAYRELVPEASLRLGLHLKGDGSYRIETYSDPNDWPTFAAAASLYHWRARNKTL